MNNRVDDAPSATVVLAKRVRPGMEAAFEHWQAGINAAARAHPGFEAAEVVRPVPGVQPEYVVVFRFDGPETLLAWLESEERAGWIERGKPLLETAPIQHTIATPKSSTVTVVVTHRVKPGAEARYRTWQNDIAAAVEKFEGFVSTETFEPHDGALDWVVVFRFRTAEHLQGWLDSKVRARWLSRAEPLLESWDLHRIGGGLGGWFEVSRDQRLARTAPAWKQALVVLFALYPTVMAVRLGLGPWLQDLPTAVQVLTGNVASIIALTWVLMPASTRLMRAWLDPRATGRVTALGTVSIGLAVAAMTLAFWALEARPF